MVSILSWWQGGSEYSCTILQLSIQWATVKRATKTCNLQVCIIAVKRVGKLEKAMLQGFPLCIQINMSSNRLAWISDDYFESFLLPQSEQQINLRNLHSLNLQQTWFQRQIWEFFKNGFASVTEEKANVPRPRNDWIICGLSLIWISQGIWCSITKD